MNQNGNDISHTSREHHIPVVCDSFDEWISQVGDHDMRFDGAFFVCNLFGEVLNRYACPDMAASVGHLDFGCSWKEERIGPNAVHDCIENRQFSRVDHDRHTEPGLRDYDSLAIPVQSDSGKAVLAVLGMLVKSGSLPASGLFLKNAALAYRSCLLMNVERKINRRLTSRHRKFEKEAKLKETLFQMARKFHSRNDAGSVLAELMDTMKMTYPSMVVQLHLSQDFHHPDFPVKPFPFNQEEDDLCTRAFMEGEVLVDADEKTGGGTIAVPLCGKQAAYGVLKIRSDSELIGESDIPFISMLADAAGIAFENARLFEESNLLINELRLINEITRRLNQSLHIRDIFKFASEELIRIFKAEYSCILKFDREQDRLVVQSGNIPELMRESFPLDYGFSGMVMHSKEPVIVSDYQTERKVESRLMEITGSRSLMATPIVVNAEPIGAVLITHREPKYFTYENFRLLRVLSGHIGLALTNATLHDEVRRMAITDRLTGLYIRHHLTDQIKLKQASDEYGSLILADIDFFKKINDTYGHQVGDESLRQVSRIITDTKRPDDIAARWGGEELAIYMPRVRIDSAVRLAERMRINICENTDPQITISSGVAEWARTDEKVSVEHLFYKADMAMYRAKRTGRNRVVAEEK